MCGLTKRFMRRGKIKNILIFERLRSLHALIFQDVALGSADLFDRKLILLTTFEDMGCLTNLTIVYLVPLWNIATAYKYLPHVSHTQFGTSHISFHKYTAVITSIPHHVLIVYSNLYCSGSLIRSRIVVTAASCFEKRTNDAPVIVKLGSTLVTGLGKVIEVLDIKCHEYFGHDTNRNNDIAILILKEHVTFGENVKKIVLIEPEVALRVGTVLDVSGWGSANLKSRFMNVLLWSEMSVMNREECKKVYPHLITPSNFCVKYQPERQLSDNGGPAEYDELLVGIVSFGAARSDEPYVAVLTNVSYFNRWIALNSRRFLEKYCVAHIYTDTDEDHDS